MSLLAGYAMRAARRRVVTGIVAFLVTVALVIVAAIVMPREYRVEVEILTQEAMIDPNNPVAVVESPIKNVPELFMARDNLAELITDAGLLELWDVERPPIGRVKDEIRDLVGLQPGTEQDKREALLEMLKTKVFVTTKGDVLIFTVQWSDPKTTFALAEAARSRFLEMQKKKELSKPRDTAALLERNVASSLKSVNEAGEQVSEVMRKKGIGVRPSLRPRMTGGESGGEGRPINTAEIARLRSKLAETRQQVQDVEKYFRSTCEQAQSALATLRKQLGPDHPDFAQAARAVNTDCRPPPEYTKMKADEAQLLAQISRLEGTSKPRENGGQAEAPAPIPQTETEDPEVQRMLAALSVQEQGYYELVGRLANTRLQIEAVEAAFSYRYTTTQAAIMPKKAVKPNVPMVIGGGIFLAFLLGFVIAVAADILSMRIMEAWQIERFVGLQVLGEVEPP